MKRYQVLLLVESLGRMVRAWWASAVTPVSKVWHRVCIVMTDDNPFQSPQTVSSAAPDPERLLLSDWVKAGVSFVLVTWGTWFAVVIVLGFLLLAWIGLGGEPLRAILMPFVTLLMIGSPALGIYSAYRTLVNARQSRVLKTRFARSGSERYESIHAPQE